MKLKDLVNKSFIFSKNNPIGMFADSEAYGLRIGTSKDGYTFEGEKSIGLIFVGYSNIDKEVYCSVLTKDYLEYNTIDEKTIFHFIK
jgi:hypothetical protein